MPVLQAAAGSPLYKDKVSRRCDGSNSLESLGKYEMTQNWCHINTYRYGY